MIILRNNPKLANEIWKSVERLRGKFKTYEYQSVTLPSRTALKADYVLINLPFLLRVRS